MAKILIKNGRVWDGEGFSYADVLTDGATVRMALTEKTDLVLLTSRSTRMAISSSP